MARHKPVEREHEPQRRHRIAIDEAYKKMPTRLCLGCEHQIMSSGKGQPELSVHNDSRLSARYGALATRKKAYFNSLHGLGVMPDSASTIGQPAAP